MNKLTPQVPFPNCFIDPTAELSGEVGLAEQDYIGPFVRVEAREPFRVQLSSQDNLQDHVLLRAITQHTTVGARTSIAHGAQVRDAVIGDFVFVGFNASIENAVIADGVLVLHGAVVRGVRIPRDRVVPAGAVITDAAQVAELPALVDANIAFKEEVLAVNVEFAEAYPRLLLERGPQSVQGVSPNPQTSWNPQPVAPQLGEDVSIAADARVIGGVQIGAGSRVGSRAAIRGDEGAPIQIGAGARVASRVTFHALEGQSITAGSQLWVEEGAVLHGALTLGDQVRVGEQAVVFKSTVGSRVRIGSHALVIGVSLADGTQVPDGARVLDQSAADRLAPNVGQ